MMIKVRLLTSLLISLLFISGCMSQSIEEEIQKQLICEDDISVLYEGVVEEKDSQSVVANVRAIGELDNMSNNLVFTEPLSGTFSVISLPCDNPCEELEFKLENAIAPVRLDSADFDGDGSNELILSDICLLYTSPSPRDGLLSRMPSSA